MENLKIDTKNHWVIWRAPAQQVQNDMLSWRMLEHNMITGILPFDYYYVDNDICFRYSYHPLQPMGEFFQQKMGDFETISFICEEVLRALEQGEEYLMNKKGYLLLPEWIFWNRFEKKICVCYLPGREETDKNEYVALVEYLMQKTDHSDKRAVAFVYDLYDMVTSEGVVLENIIQYIREKKAEIIDAVPEHIEAVKQEHCKYCFCLRPVLRESAGKLQGIIAKSQETVSYVISQKELAVGRHRESEIYLPFAVISRRHAVFVYENGELYLMDAASKNGTYLNGRKISAYVKTRCKENDVITFADISYRLVQQK